MTAAGWHQVNPAAAKMEGQSHSLSHLTDDFVRHSYTEMKDIHSLLSLMLFCIGALSKDIPAMRYRGSISYLYSIIFIFAENLAPLLKGLDYR